MVHMVCDVRLNCNITHDCIKNLVVWWKYLLNWKKGNFLNSWLSSYDWTISYVAYFSLTKSLSLSLVRTLILSFKWTVNTKEKRLYQKSYTEYILLAHSFKIGIAVVLFQIHHRAQNLNRWLIMFKQFIYFYLSFS